MTAQEFGHLNDETKEFLRSIRDATEKGGIICYGNKTVLNPIRAGAPDIEDLEELEDQQLDFTIHTQVEYKGELNLEGQPHGYGHVTFKDTRVFLATFRNGLAHGVGILMANKSSQFIGEMQDGFWIGKGTEHYGFFEYLP